MGLLRCTQKVLTEVGIKAASLHEGDDPAEELALWYANLIHLARKKTLIFANPATCFSLVVPAVRRAEVKDLPTVFVNALASALRFEEVEDETAARVVSLFEVTHIGKTKDRRPLGVMNDLAKHIEAHLYYDYAGDVSLMDGRLLKKLNRIPWSGLKFQTGVEQLGHVLRERYGWEGRFAR